jgi:hypothetical protein
MIEYIVWVGDVAVFHTKNFTAAQDNYRHWIINNFDNVFLEKVLP